MAQPKVFKVVKGRRVPDDYRPAPGEVVKWRFIVDVGTDPKTGRRKQKTVTCDGKREAQKRLSKILSEVDGGTFVIPAKVTLNELCDEWLRSRRGKAANTIAAYTNGLKPAREQLGERPAQKVTVRDINDLVDHMLTAGRRRGGQPGTGLSPRSVQITLSKLRAVYAWAMRQRLVDVNPAAMVDTPDQVKVRRDPWSPDEVRTFLGSLTEKRLHAPAMLALLGLRPAELAGLRWAEDVDLDAETIRPGDNTRTLTWGPDGGHVVEKGGKTESSRRTLPLPPQVTATLRAFRTLQAKERLAAGEGYQASGYVLVDELGRPYKTDQWRRAMHKLMAEAGVRKVRPYDARHACLTFLAVNGVPDVVVSAWAGHSDLTTAKKHYVHPSADDLVQGRDALRKLLG